MYMVTHTDESPGQTGCGVLPYLMAHTVPELWEPQDDPEVERGRRAALADIADDLLAELAAEQLLGDPDDELPVWGWAA